MQETIPVAYRFRWGDGIIALLLLAATALTFPAFKSLTPACAEIFLENTRIATYPLDNDRVFTVKGHEGPVRIVIRNRRVSIDHASCPRGICMKTGAIGTPYAQIVCAPNRVLVTITSNRPDTLDAVAR